jgi:hypothetical protein
VDITCAVAFGLRAVAAPLRGKAGRLASGLHVEHVPARPSEAADLDANAPVGDGDAGRVEADEVVPGSPPGPNRVAPAELAPPPAPGTRLCLQAPSDVRRRGDEARLPGRPAGRDPPALPMPRPRPVQNAAGLQHVCVPRVLAGARIAAPADEAHRRGCWHRPRRGDHLTRKRPPCSGARRRAPARPPGRARTRPRRRALPSTPPARPGAGGTRSAAPPAPHVPGMGASSVMVYPRTVYADVSSFIGKAFKAAPSR